MAESIEYPRLSWKTAAAGRLPSAASSIRRMGAPIVSRGATATLLGVAVLFTLLNAVKPLTVDDTVYYYFARQIAEHPADPYGFEIFWQDRPKPALHQVAPIVQPLGPVPPVPHRTFLA